MILYHKGLLQQQISKNNSKNNKLYNSKAEKKGELCLRLRILFVTFCGPTFKKMCAIPYGFDRKRYTKREAETVSLFAFYVVATLLSVELEDCHEGTLRNLDGSDLAHSFLSLLLLFQKFPLSGDVSSVTFCRNILTDRFDGLSGDDFCTHCCLNGNIELLTRDKFLELLTHLASEIICMVCMNQS